MEPGTAPERLADQHQAVAHKYHLKELGGLLGKAYPGTYICAPTTLQGCNANLPASCLQQGISNTRPASLSFLKSRRHLSCCNLVLWSHQLGMPALHLEQEVLSRLQPPQCALPPKRGVQRGVVRRWQRNA
jgi:hypothetical protein